VNAQARNSSPPSSSSSVVSFMLSSLASALPRNAPACCRHVHGKEPLRHTSTTWIARSTRAIECDRVLVEDG
jgi:hypothetical protein